MTLRCYKHPDRETALTCGSCGRPICTRCVVQHPVGIRCEECARPTRIPTLDVTPSYYTRAIAAAVGISVAGVIGLVLAAFILSPLGLVGFYMWLAALGGFGYLMGKGVGLAVNRKRGLGLQWVAGIGVGVTYVITISLPWLAAGGIYSAFGLVAAIYLAARELRI